MSERSCEAVGIDLGTTYSSLAYMDAQAMPRVVCDSGGQTVIPSVIYFDEEEIVVGDVALSQAKLHSDRCVQFVKVYMGENWRKEFNGHLHTPESLSALILGHLIRESEPQIGPIRKAVITVPAYFTEKRRRATQQAGEIAGLDVIGTLNEPMSAALAYGLHRTEREHFAVIYDLGGGTFDVTIVRIAPNEIEELATNGNRQLGGRDWDQALVDLVCDNFQRHYKVNPSDSPQALQDLLIECEKAKRRLARMAKTSIRLHAFEHDHITEITRDEFESRTAFLVQATKLTTELALEDAKLDWRQISRIVLVGGSTQLPSVRKMLKDVSGIQPDAGVNPVVAVALGAAVYAHMLETGRSIKTLRQKPNVEPKESNPAVPPLAGRIPAELPLTPVTETAPRVKFVTAHGVGVKTLAAGRWQNVVLIPKNSPVPIKFTKRFRTSPVVVNSKAPNAFISIEITQGDTKDIELAEVLGTGRISLPREKKPGNPVDVTMEFNDQGRLHASAVYVNTGQSMDMTLEVQGGLRQDEVKVYREFMDRTGFARSFNMDQAVAKLESDDDDDDDQSPMIELI